MMMRTVSLESTENDHLIPERIYKLTREGMHNSSNNRECFEKTPG